MAAVGHYTFFDFQALGAQSKERLNMLLAKKDIKVDETTQNKNAILSQIYQDLGIHQLIYEFKRVDSAHDKTLIEDQNLKKNILDCKIATLINKALTHRLIEEAIAVFMLNEKIKEGNAQIRSLMLKEAEEASSRRYAQYLLEQARMMEQSILLDLNNASDNLLNLLNSYSNQINDLEGMISRIQELRQKTEDHYVDKAVKEVEEFKIDGEDPLQGVSKEQKEQFSKEYIKQRNVLLTRAEEVDKQITEEEAIIQDLEKLREIELKRVQEDKEKLLSSSDAPQPDLRQLAELNAREARINEQYNQLLQDLVNNQQAEEQIAGRIKKLDEKQHHHKDKGSEEKNKKYEEKLEKKITRLEKRLEKIKDEKLEIETNIEKLKKERDALKAQNEALNRKALDKGMPAGKKGMFIIAKRHMASSQEKKRIKELDKEIEKHKKKLEYLQEEKSEIREQLDGLFDSLSEKWGLVASCVTDFFRHHGKKKQLNAKLDAVSDAHHQEDKKLAKTQKECQDQIHHLEKKAEEAYVAYHEERNQALNSLGKMKGKSFTPDDQTAQNMAKVDEAYQRLQSRNVGQTLSQAMGQ